MRTCPIKDMGHLLPIAHLLKRHLLHRCSSNDHTIVIVPLNRLKVLIKLSHVLHGRVLRCVPLDLHEIKLHLQRGIAQESH